MKYIKLFCLVLTLAVVIPALAQNPKTKYKYGVYMVGVSASFTDSLVYFTDIQLVDSAALGEKDLLAERAQYSMQLKEYIEEHQNGRNRTCFVYYNLKKKKLQKEITKLRTKYQKNQSMVILDVNPEFRFTKADLY